MSRGQRVGVAVLLLTAVLAWGWWLWRRTAGTTEPVSSAAATPRGKSPTVPATTPLQVPRGYRLAGVAVGEPESFAVVETPGGANVLYRVNADIPGLGRLVRIDAEHIVVQGDAGRLELWLMPAATPTPTRLRTLAARVATAAPRTALPQATLATATPKPPAAAGVSVPGSTPSAAQGSPAS